MIQPAYNSRSSGNIDKRARSNQKSPVQTDDQSILLVVIKWNRRLFQQHMPRLADAGSWKNVHDEQLPCIIGHPVFRNRADRNTSSIQRTTVISILSLILLMSLNIPHQLLLRPYSA